MTKRATTAQAYKQPLVHWRIFCENNGDRFPIANDNNLYTVGPEKMIKAFFEEFFLKRKSKKHVTLNTDIRIQTSIKNEDDNEETSTPTLTEIIENAPFEKNNNNRKVIESPLGIESVKQYKKALINLQEYQQQIRTIPFPKVKDIREVMDLIKQYENNIQYQQLQTGRDGAAHCVLRDSYKPRDLIRMLNDLWCRSNLRERLSLSTRHHMLLRDEDLRYLNFSDCFATVMPKLQHKGSQQGVILVFSLDKGKTLKEGELKFACAMRHNKPDSIKLGHLIMICVSCPLKISLFLDEETEDIPYTFK